MIIHIPMKYKSDDLIVMLTATYLTSKKDILEMASYPTAVTLLAALQDYSQDHDIKKYAEKLDIDDKSFLSYQKDLLGEEDK